MGIFLLCQFSWTNLWVSAIKVRQTCRPAEAHQRSRGELCAADSETSWKLLQSSCWCWVSWPSLTVNPVIKNLKTQVFFIEARFIWVFLQPGPAKRHPSIILQYRLMLDRGKLSWETRTIRHISWVDPLGTNWVQSNSSTSPWDLQESGELTLQRGSSNM